jgi:23S rRNA pseudouridine2604 synthase
MDLNTFLVKKLSLSKQQAIELIKTKKVLINGKPGSQRQLLAPSDRVEADGGLLQEPTFFNYILYYKPKGVECTLNPEIENSLPAAFPACLGLFPVGRLDKDSEGLLLLTDDGKLYKDVAGSEKHQEKEYFVKLNNDISEDDLEKMASGIVIMGKKTRPALVIRQTASSFNIVLTQGLNRQIRRMCYKLGYEVEILKRIRIMSLYLEDLEPGEYREILRRKF